VLASDSRDPEVPLGQVFIDQLKSRRPDERDGHLSLVVETSKRSRKFELRLDDEPLDPGGRLKGVLVAMTAMRARGLEVALRFIDEDEAGDYRGEVTHESAVLHEGDITPGQEFDLSLSLPADALPAHASYYGRLFSALGVHVDVPRERDVKEEFEVEVSAPEPAPDSGMAEPLEAWQPKRRRRSRSTGTLTWPPRTWARRKRRASKRWDVEVRPSVEELRRGEEIAVDVTIADAGPGRNRVQVGLVCYARYYVPGESRRYSKTEPDHERWPELDPRSPQQQLRFRIPSLDVLPGDVVNAADRRPVPD
jgi:hypothetical protein